MSKTKGAKVLDCAMAGKDARVSNIPWNGKLPKNKRWREDCKLLRQYGVSYQEQGQISGMWHETASTSIFDRKRKFYRVKGIWHEHYMEAQNKGVVFDVFSTSFNLWLIGLKIYNFLYPQNYYRVNLDLTKIDQQEEPIFLDGHEVKIGSNMWDIRRGWGVVVRMPRSLDYPIVVHFDRDTTRGGGFYSYDKNGYFLSEDKTRSLFWNEVKIIQPAPPAVESHKQPENTGDVLYDWECQGAHVTNKFFNVSAKWIKKNALNFTPIWRISKDGTRNLMQRSDFEIKQDGMVFDWYVEYDGGFCRVNCKTEKYMAHQPLAIVNIQKIDGTGRQP